MSLLCYKLILILVVVAATLFLFNVNTDKRIVMRSQWFRVLSSGSVATWLLGLRVRIPLGHGFLSLMIICIVE